MAKPARSSGKLAASDTASTPDARSGHAHHAPDSVVRLTLGIICFLAGASVMVIEISAYRLLAPLFGNSVYTWTALIGVILISFSAGGFLGGWLADRRLALDLLGWLLAGSSVLTFFIPALHSLFGTGLSDQGIIAGPVIISILLFAVPGVLLGAISPAAVRFYSLTQKDTHVGAAAGTISMLGSLGSFVGTFLSGFVLLSHFGVRSIFLGTGSVLLLLAVLAFFLAHNSVRQQLPIWISGLIAGTIGWTTHDAPDKDVIYQHESFYHRIEVSERHIGSQTERYLKLDSTLEGGMNPDDGSIILGYQNYWKLARLRDDRPISSALFIGAGAFGMPEEVSREFPQARVDVVEIDPHVIEVGHKFFKLDEHPRVNAHAGDARRYLLQSKDTKWDMIFGDAYNGIRQIPSHLATKEFFQLIADRLSDRGVFLMNVITAVNGKKSELLGGMVGTLKAVFPHVEAFAVGGSRTEPQNVILLASNDDWRSIFTDRTYVAGTWESRLANSYVPPHLLPDPGPVFTDDLNPVDAIIARQLLQ